MMRYVQTINLRDRYDDVIRERACAWITALGLDPAKIVQEGLPQIEDDTVTMFATEVPSHATFDPPDIIGGEMVQYRIHVPLTALPEAFGLDYYAEPVAQLHV